MSGRYWTPYELEIILHHYASLDRFPRDTAPAYGPTIAELQHRGLLELREGAMRTSDMGDHFVEMLLHTPPPRSVWLDPRDHKEVLLEGMIPTPPREADE